MNVNTQNTRAVSHEIQFADSLTSNQKKKRPKPTPPTRISSLKSSNHAHPPTTKIEVRASVHSSRYFITSEKPVQPNGSNLSDSNSSVGSILSSSVYEERVAEAEDLIERINSNFYKIPSATSAETDALRMVFIETTLKQLYEISSLIDQAVDSQGNTFFSSDPSHDAFNKKMSTLSFDYQNEKINYDAKQAALLLKCYHEEYFQQLRPYTVKERETLLTILQNREKQFSSAFQAPRSG